MTAKSEQPPYYGEWRHWKHWSRWEKISSVGVLLIVLLCHLFFNYILPKLAEKEQKAASTTSESTRLQIPKPDVPIPANPNTRP